MSYTRPLKARETALEDAFFRDESQRLLDAMRARASREEQVEGLADVLGVRDPAIIDPLFDLGLREQNAAALVVAPLVCVAWADHQLDSAERRAIHKAEAEHDIDPASDAGRLLEIWLEHRPHESLLDAWAAYVKELFPILEEQERERLRGDILSRARRIAGAVEKSFLRGRGPVRAEQKVVEQIESALEIATGKPEPKGPDALDAAICSST